MSVTGRFFFFVPEHQKREGTRWTEAEEALPRILDKLHRGLCEMFQRFGLHKRRHVVTAGCLCARGHTSTLPWFQHARWTSFVSRTQWQKNLHVRRNNDSVWRRKKKAHLVGKSKKYWLFFLFVRSVFLTLGSLEGVELGGLDVVNQGGHLLRGHSLPLRRALRSINKYTNELRTNVKIPTWWRWCHVVGKRSCQLSSWTKTCDHLYTPAVGLEKSSQPGNDNKDISNGHSRQPTTSKCTLIPPSSSMWAPSQHLVGAGLYWPVPLAFMTSQRASFNQRCLLIRAQTHTYVLSRSEGEQAEEMGDEQTHLTWATVKQTGNTLFSCLRSDLLLTFLPSSSSSSSSSSLSASISAEIGGAQLVMGVNCLALAVFFLNPADTKAQVNFKEVGPQVARKVLI